MPRTTDWVFWGLLLLAAVMELVGDLALKWWAETNRWGGLALGLAVYTVAVAIFALLLRRAELAVIFALWVGVATVLLALAGWWLFKESLSWGQIAGLALTVGGVLLLGLKV